MKEILHHQSWVFFLKLCEKKINKTKYNYLEYKLAILKKRKYRKVKAMENIPIIADNSR